MRCESDGVDKSDKMEGCVAKRRGSPWQHASHTGQALRSLGEIAWIKPINVRDGSSP